MAASGRGRKDSCRDRESDITYFIQYFSCVHVFSHVQSVGGRCQEGVVLKSAQHHLLILRNILCFSVCDLVIFKARQVSKVKE